MNRFLRLAIPWVAVAVTPALVSCGGDSSASPPPPAITVSVAPATSTVPAGTTQALTATLQNDSSQRGVTWAISPASGAGTLSNATSTSVTYTAPASAPPSDMTVTITATSVADPTRSAAASVTVPALSVAVDPSTATVDAGGTQTLTATVQGDPAGKGVTWSISPTSGAGTLSNATSTSVTYTAPASAPPSDMTVTITATSVTDPTKNAAAMVTVAALYVVVDPSAPVVLAGGTQTLTATVHSDPAGKGVTWTISPTSGAGTLSNATSTSVTYTAPPSAPASDVNVIVTATSLTDPTRSGIATIVLPMPSVSVDPSTVTLDAGGTQTFTASVGNDPAQRGVTWAISPQSGAGALANITSTSVTYEAPAAPPAADLKVTITATSVSYPLLSGTAAVTVKAITVSVAPATALMPLRAEQAFTSTVQHDAANRGVTWLLTQAGSACAPACGTVSSSDATTAAYVAPATMPASPGVTLNAVSVTNSADSGSALITLSTGVVKLVPYTLDFGYVKPSRAKQLTTTLTNTSGTALAVTSIAIAGTNPDKFSQTNTCGASVAAVNSCDIHVTFAPHGTTGPLSASLVITDSDVTSPQRVTLSGFACVGNSCPHGTALSSVVGAAKTAAAPAPTGSQWVGTRIMQVTDAARADPLLANGSRRELMLRFWYPASVDHASCRRAPYTSPAVWSYFSELAGVPLPAVRTNSCLDAPVAHGAYPVVVFSHGLTGTFTDYTFLFEDLASRGYIVVSVDHTYEATAVAFADGRMARSFYGSHLTRIVRLDESALVLAESVRVGDLQFVVDELQRLDARPDSPFAAHLDLAAIATAGHSLGGLTALEALGADARIRAAIVLDGVRPGATFAATDRPVLLLDANREEWSRDERALWSKLQGPRLAVNLERSEHITPTDLVWLARGAVKTGGMSPEAAIAAMRDYIAAFLDAYLQGRPPDRLLTQRSAAYPDAELTLPQQVP